jgi:hypothetical protein
MITPDRPILVWPGRRSSILPRCLSSHQIISQLVPTGLHRLTRHKLSHRRQDSSSDWLGVLLLLILLLELEKLVQDAQTCKVERR